MLIYIYIYTLIYFRCYNNVDIFIVQVTCGSGTLSPSCEVCPKPADTQIDDQWCDGNCRIDTIDGECKEKRRLCS